MLEARLPTGGPLKAAAKGSLADLASAQPAVACLKRPRSPSIQFPHRSLKQPKPGNALVGRDLVQRKEERLPENILICVAAVGRMHFENCFSVPLLLRKAGVPLHQCCPGGPYIVEYLAVGRGPRTITNRVVARNAEAKKHFMNTIATIGRERLAQCGIVVSDWVWPGQNAFSRLCHYKDTN